MPTPFARLLLAASVALVTGAAGRLPEAVGAEKAAGRDLVIDAGGHSIRVRVVPTVDGKSVEDRRRALIDSLVASVALDEKGRIPADAWRLVYQRIGLWPRESGNRVPSPQALADRLAEDLGPLTEVVVQPLPLVDRLELFVALDTDDDGSVTAAELGDIGHLFARYDADGDGTLNAPELAPTEPLQPTPIRSGADFPPGRSPFRWEEPAGTPDAVVEIKLIGRAFGRPKVVVSGGVVSGESSKPPTTHNSPLTVTSEPRKASFDLSGIGLDLDATPARITSDDVKRFYLLQLRQRDADKNGYLSEEEFAGLGLPGLDYKAADANGDGMLFPKELSERMDAVIARETSRVRVEASFERQPLFTKLDADGDGRLSRRELRNAPRSLSSVDADGDGRIGLAEFGGRYRLSFAVPNLLDGSNPRMVADVEAMSGGSSPRASEGPSWFAAMDRNTDGDLTRREFLGTAERFAAMDADGDGLLSPEEAAKADEAGKNEESVSTNEGVSGE
jgi:Ca2+-binding EF-hand superfamily protein